VLKESTAGEARISDVVAVLGAKLALTDQAGVALCAAK
jgi:hypothetical protein